MTKPDSRKIVEIAGETGFLPDTVEKVLRLTGILAEIQSHPLMQNKFALKGGTAIHLFHLSERRLSVDLDLNYVGSVGREETLALRPRVEEAMQRLLTSLGYQVRRIPPDHAGGKWQLRYSGHLGQPQVLELDINYLFRVPIWGVEEKTVSWSVFRQNQLTFPIVHPLELWGGKIVATISRAEPRDLFDLIYMPQSIRKSRNLPRTVTFLGSGTRNDWSTIQLNMLDNITSENLHRRLLPVVRTEEPMNWKGLADKARQTLRPLLRFREREKLYLRLLEKEGKYQPEILFPEKELQEKLEQHPLLLWKAQNRREFLNSST